MTLKYPSDKNFDVIHPPIWTPNSIKQKLVDPEFSTPHSFFIVALKMLPWEFS